MLAVRPESFDRGATAGHPGAAGGRFLARLVLTDFRCYGRAELRLGRGAVVLSGPNGAGKTNVLEAVSLLSPGRGLRLAKPGDIARQGGSGGFAVAASLEGGDLPAALDLGTAVQPGSERRAVKRDGAAATQASLARDLSLLWLTPAMDRLWTEGAAGRRRFLDRLVMARRPDHAEAHVAYDKAREERIRLLTLGPRDGQWLSGLEARIARAGAAIALNRRDAVAALNAAMAEADNGFPVARLALTGEVENWPEPAADEIAARLQAGLAAARGRDAEAGAQTLGPHRGDLAALHAGKALPAPQCSTGEQKALLISIVLAQAALVGADSGRAPVLLLDEVAAHLDPGRRGLLYDQIVARGGQAFLTGTERSLFDGLDGRAQFLDVRDGLVAPASPQ
ncbi:DNA replication/repair protein RecF [Zavarzinia compransoris]|uniref:DNA replication and repair protein RecF n=1 Tax=Zavarzinia compransoris TaxID=1264899 RepID=A0A317E231_9PROT|nr:DNA replication/repair protein RecF [Zavarzinia compransoris]PWR20474.1 DNA replication/repair protein RecF [Zavarzinia compransoris]TDP43882.1 DNA replication and repair protein RecF [Zavarzinia compransoris]